MSAVLQNMAEHGIEETPFHVGEGFSKLYRIPAGKVVGQHAHKTSHDSVLLIGCVVVKRDDVEITLYAPAIMPMPAHVGHSIQALTDSLWACNWPKGI